MPRLRLSNSAPTLLQQRRAHGEVAEWLNVPVSKTGIRCKGIVGSNPTLSASQVPHGSLRTQGRSFSHERADARSDSNPGTATTWPDKFPGLLADLHAIRTTSLRTPRLWSWTRGRVIVEDPAAIFAFDLLWLNGWLETIR